MKGTLVVRNLIIIIQLCSAPQLYDAFEHLLAHCFGFTPFTFTVLVQSQGSHYHLDFILLEVFCIVTVIAEFSW